MCRHMRADDSWTEQSVDLLPASKAEFRAQGARIDALEKSDAVEFASVKATVQTLLSLVVSHLGLSFLCTVTINFRFPALAKVEFLAPGLPFCHK